MRFIKRTVGGAILVFLATISPAVANTGWIGDSPNASVNYNDPGSATVTLVSGWLTGGDGYSSGSSDTSGGGSRSGTGGGSSSDGSTHHSGGNSSGGSSSDLTTVTNQLVDAAVSEVARSMAQSVAGILKKDPSASGKGVDYGTEVISVGSGTDITISWTSVRTTGSKYVSSTQALWYDWKIINRDTGKTYEWKKQPPKKSITVTLNEPGTYNVYYETWVKKTYEQDETITVTATASIGGEAHQGKASTTITHSAGSTEGYDPSWTFLLKFILATNEVGKPITIPDDVTKTIPIPVDTEQVSAE